MTLDCSGQTGLFSPEWSLNFGIEQTLDLGDFNLVLSSDFRYRDEQETSTAYTAETVQDAYTLVDLSATLRPDDGSWYITLYGNNVGDEEYGAYAVAPGAGNALSASYSGPPVTYGARLGIDF